MKQVLTILEQFNFELNYKKCVFVKKRIEYLGYIISSEGITLRCTRHTQEDSPEPTDVTSVQRFLGLTSYFRKFVRNYARKAKPLYNLLKKKNGSM